MFIDPGTHSMVDLFAFQDQRYRRYISAISADLPKIGVRSDSVQNETIVAMQQHAGEATLDIFYFRQLKQLVALWIHDTIQKSEPKRCTKLKRMKTGGVQLEELMYS